jgi:hypothetical protein
MTDSPITQSQLDALEKAADRVFAKLGIDIEFTRHFIDRVNDERNRKQITIRELGALLAKEYTRWGNTIAKMPVSAEAVMKDLGSAINMPFVIDKNGNGKDLIAKTIMRKKDFKTPDRAFPVESVEEMHGAEKGKQVKGRSATPSMGKPTTGGSSPHPMRGKLVGEQAATEVAQPPLDVTTPSSIAKKHGVDTSMVMKNLKEGFKIEAETTPDKYTAMEIALGHINEMPNYYTKSDNVVASINEMLVKGAWECQQLRERITDPREAMLRKALAYLEEMHEANGDQQSISGYAFDIIRSFNLKNIVNAKELADLYCQWKNVNKDIMC